MKIPEKLLDPARRGPMPRKHRHPVKRSDLAREKLIQQMVPNVGPRRHS